MICSIRDVPVYYKEYGEGKPLLSIHGWSVDHRLMSGCLEPIFNEIQGYRRIYLDLPGMGKTPVASWIRNSDNMLELLGEFINAVIPDENFLVAGESYGGRLSLGLIHTAGERIDGVLLICSNHPESENLPVKQTIWKSEALKAKENDPDMDAYMELAVVAAPEMFEKYKNDVLPGIKAADYNFLTNHLTGSYGPELENKLKTTRFDKPACILAGRQDHWVGYTGAYKLLEGFPRATFAVLDGAGHNLQIENEPLFNQMVKDWLWRVNLR
ncbi:MAG: alpha/beta hydrolase [Oscillospiraceae bacterium]|nr:alpha/beta hydrolase [Oscillospiraceae bacterium]